ncbi:sensor histidine kinase [Rugamonas sp. CCM 8940]|uniref:sensor histidine kinase n=1 Tax=Rugamonas sp. CCM 8940 TaxID=2765359 RepID=UPI0018F28EC2|nr:HAMP domain-containing sensor histidine kinase [Rugamonas sp. CCM 8940]MBJ7313232.1 HAMP domain-containing histidine kinase [Rugamonas sp. CCM 8940]
MMHEFLIANRTELERRCRDKVSARPDRSPNRQQLEQGIPKFLDQLIRTLQAESEGALAQALAVSGPAAGDPYRIAELGVSAGIHGADLLTLGYSINEVVHDYGDLCQAVSDLSMDLDEKFEISEFRTLNRCLDNGIADAVTAFSEHRDVAIADEQALETNERLGFFAHELRNHLNTAMLALAAIKSGSVGLGGPTGAVLDRSLIGLRRLIDRSLAEVRIGPGMTLHRSVFSLAHFIGEMKYSAALEAELLDCGFNVEPISPVLMVDVDKDLLFSALGNLLQNAFKFSGKGGAVTLSVDTQEDRIRIRVKDSGPGLSAESAHNMFLPFTQSGSNRNGLGLGLSIARRSVEANGGLLIVESKLGDGCVFVIDLPRR